MLKVDVHLNQSKQVLNEVQASLEQGRLGMTKWSISRHKWNLEKKYTERMGMGFERLDRRRVYTNTIKNFAIILTTS